MAVSIGQPEVLIYPTSPTHKEHPAMYRTLALAMAAWVWGLPAAAVSVTVEFVGVISEIPTIFRPAGLFAGETAAGVLGESVDVLPAPGAIVIDPPIDAGAPSLGDTVSGSVSFEIEKDQVENVSGALPIGSANPPLEAARVSPVERSQCAEPCVTIGPVPPPLIPIEETQDRGTLTVEYGPNAIFGPSFDIVTEWTNAAILIAAPVDDDAPPSSFTDLLEADGALPLHVQYTRITRGNLMLPGIDPDDCNVHSCTTIGATVTSGAIRVGDGPTPIPAPPAVVALIAALGALFALRRSARV